MSCCAKLSLALLLRLGNTFASHREQRSGAMPTQAAERAALSTLEGGMQLARLALMFAFCRLGNLRAPTAMFKTVV